MLPHWFQCGIIVTEGCGGKQLSECLLRNSPPRLSGVCWCVFGGVRYPTSPQAPKRIHELPRLTVSRWYHLSRSRLSSRANSLPIVHPRTSGTRGPRVSKCTGELGAGGVVFLGRSRARVWEHPRVPHEFLCGLRQWDARPGWQTDGWQTGQFRTFSLPMTYPIDDP